MEAVSFNLFATEYTQYKYNCSTMWYVLLRGALFGIVN